MARFEMVAMALMAVGSVANMSTKFHGLNRNASGRIVNGRPSGQCEWPYQVGLLLGGMFESTYPYCGGVLIRADRVLTAGHCLHVFHPKNEAKVIAGEWDVNSISGNEQIRSASEIEAIYHPRYNGLTLEFDFGILELRTPFTLNDCVGVVTLPSADVAHGTSCWISGWGLLEHDGISPGERPGVLQAVEVVAIGNNECVSDYDWTDSNITDSMLCAAGRTVTGDITDACFGDSGGPLACEDEKGSWVLHGITSWGPENCANSSYPGIWARVYNQLSWIKDGVMGPDHECKIPLRD